MQDILFAQIPSRIAKKLKLKVSLVSNVRHVNFNAAVFNIDKSDTPQNTRTPFVTSRSIYAAGVKWETLFGES